MAEKITGAVLDVIVQKDNGWAVLQMQNKITGGNHPVFFKATGVFPTTVKKGVTLTLEGVWEDKGKYGRQFKTINFIEEAPQTAADMELYLSSELVKGVGPALAKKIVATFGDKTFDILDNHPEKLLTISGIGKEKLKMIADSWSQHKEERNTLLFLRKLDVSSNMAIKLYQKYGSGIVTTIKQNPYMLVKLVRNFGFKKADAIASKMGFPPDFPGRVKAGITHVIDAANSEGSTAVPTGDLIIAACSLLDLPNNVVAKNLAEMVKSQEVFNSPSKAPESEPADSIYPAWLYRCEMGIAENIRRLMEFSLTPIVQMQLHTQDIASLTPYAEKLSVKQKQAIAHALHYPVTVLTGGPGTGKTSCLKALVDILYSHNIDFVLAAPTGRAAQRMGETTGYKASTIHRLLGYNPDAGGFKFNDDHQLPQEFFIIDEMSMVDAYLLDSLLKAVPDNAHVFLIGDADQLPSVGAGNVLNDIIARGIVPTTKLTEIFRQDDKSFIVINAHRINQGEMPIFLNDVQKNKDFFFFQNETPDDIAATVVELVTEKIPKQFGFDAKTQIQVLSPKYAGVIGVKEMNARLQQLINPPDTYKKERKAGERVFRVGDKVMQLVNDYDLNVFNGDIGYIQSINDSMMTIEFGNSYVSYPYDKLDSLTLAYCCTVHKSQGAEFDAVVIPFHESQFPMLRKNLAYTAITRAKKLVVLVGSKKAIAISVKNNMMENRHTGLALFLQQN